jgi:uncharacterized protein
MDLAGVLSQSAKDQLTALCTDVDQKAQAQIAVVTVRSLDGRPIEDYSVDLATHLGIGPKKSEAFCVRSCRICAVAITTRLFSW